ncbi:MAG TPA: molybdate ABC transporter substrate-binding protein, partial [Thermoleophilaceae bacterium]|nr:molybdate ABC transporter substrate-binding protein [Thermoleophilaceae bacterium]
AAPAAPARLAPPTAAPARLAHGAAPLRRLTATVLAAAVLLAGCGSDDEDGSPGAGGERDEPRLVVSAASSLHTALEECSARFEGADVKLSFAGSQELAAQIRQGLEPDVYAAANTDLPRELHEEGLLARPVEFVTNALVIAVPEDSDIEAVEQVAREGVKLAIGSEATPVGTYTRELLGRLPKDIAAAMLANVRSNEPEVQGIVGKLIQGAADAGFVYQSDVEAARGRLRAIPLPGELQPAVVYAAGVVEGASERQLAQEYLDGLVGGDCYDTLQRWGFGAIK